jgi:mRNA interferase MazF
MIETIETTLSLPMTLFHRADLLAKQLNIAPEELFQMAIEHFIQQYQEQLPVDELNKTVVNRGDIFWIRPENPTQSPLGYYPHPYVVIQDDLFNHSRITTVIVCALTSNLKQANAPGNVLLEVGEANLPRQSVVVVSKISTANKSQLAEYIGSLNEQRVNQILAGIRFLQSSFFA